MMITPPYGLEARPRNRQLQHSSSYIKRHLARERREEDTASRRESEESTEMCLAFQSIYLYIYLFIYIFIYIYIYIYLFITCLFGLNLGRQHPKLFGKKAVKF